MPPAEYAVACRIAVVQTTRHIKPVTMRLPEPASDLRCCRTVRCTAILRKVIDRGSLRKDCETQKTASSSPWQYARSSQLQRPYNIRGCRWGSDKKGPEPDRGETRLPLRRPSPCAPWSSTFRFLWACRSCSHAVLTPDVSQSSPSPHRDRRVAFPRLATDPPSTRQSR